MSQASLPFTPRATALASLLLLAACGGGGQSSESLAEVQADAVSDQASARVTAQALRGTSATTTTVIVRARGKLAANVGPIIQLKINGTVVGQAEVRSSELADYAFTVTSLNANDKVDVVYTNDAIIDGVNRDLFVGYILTPTVSLMPSTPGVVYDRGNGTAAFDGLDTLPGQENMAWGGALRITWPTADSALTLSKRNDASRLLQQATFGPTPSEIDRTSAMTATAWVDDQLQRIPSNDYVSYIQSKFDKGADYRPPTGKSYMADWNQYRFWATVSNAPDQLRQRVAFALHEIFVTSMSSSTLYHQARPFANYLDMLARDAFGNYRTLLQDIALSPVMGSYLSHIRNQKEDPATGRLPDENFAREIMQLFSIGLYELNADGTQKLDSQGRPIETYTNDDVMALARVFTGWSWGFDDSLLNEKNFLWMSPDYSTTGSNRVDLRPMKAYPGLSSTLEKRLFAGKANELVIPANTNATDSLRLALDALYKHPNVGPFIGRQLIQRLVTSNPSPAYVARVAAKFNNNGSGVRGDMAAVIRQVLLDSEARSPTSTTAGKVREPVLAVTHWMRAFGAKSVSGEYLMGSQLAGVAQRTPYAPTVFGFFRPGYVPPNSALAAANLVSPEMQIISETTTANWVNLVEAMATGGLGNYGSGRDVATDLASAISITASAPGKFVDHLNTVLFAGRMPTALRKNILDAMAGISSASSTRDRDRTRVALYLAMSSPEYRFQQ